MVQPSRYLFCIVDYYNTLTMAFTGEVRASLNESSKHNNKKKETTKISSFQRLLYKKYKIILL